VPVEFRRVAGSLLLQTKALRAFVLQESFKRASCCCQFVSIIYESRLQFKDNIVDPL